MDKCSQSTGREITFQDNILKQEAKEKLWWGTVNPQSIQGCTTFPGAPDKYKGTSEFSKLAYQNIAKYFTGRDDFFLH